MIREALEALGRKRTGRGRGAAITVATAEERWCSAVSVRCGCTVRMPSQPGLCKSGMSRWDLGVPRQRYPCCPCRYGFQVQIQVLSSRGKTSQNEDPGRAFYSGKDVQVQMLSSPAHLSVSGQSVEEGGKEATGGCASSTGISTITRRYRCRDTQLPKTASIVDLPAPSISPSSAMSKMTEMSEWEMEDRRVKRKM